MARRYRKQNDKTLLGLVKICFLLFLMPFFGIKLLGSKNVAYQIMGIVLIVIGSVLWIGVITR